MERAVTVTVTVTVALTLTQVAWDVQLSQLLYVSTSDGEVPASL